MEQKTNVMRLLDKAKIEYIPHYYSADAAINGVAVAAALGIDADRVFKTLVTVGKSQKNYVFVIPVNRELDLKKAASATGEKSIEMIKNKDLLPLTGYIHGGCSPVGMKKPFATFIDAHAQGFDRIVFSAGRIGYQVELGIGDLQRILPFTFADIAI